MKKILAILALVSPFLLTQAHAADAKQSKLAECSSAAKGKKGDEYKAARDACMKGEKPAEAKPEAKKTKLAECSAAAKGKTGKEYTDARDACMKKK